MERAFFFDTDFWNSVEELQTHESHRVIGAVNNYRRDPSNTGLHVEKLNGRAGNSRLWSLRASQELRVLMAREGPTTIFLRAGHHDAIYGFAERCAFVAPLAGKPGLIGLKRPSPSEPRHASETTAHNAREAVRQEGPLLVEHWSTVELKRAGFSADEIGLLRRSNTDTLLDVWPEIDAQTLDKVMECSEKPPDDWFQAQLVDDEDAANERFRDAIIERGALAGLSSLLTADELERLMRAPIEEWMIFLHPDQRDLVERRFSGPARVRGSAGTGKTVVGLHRAVSLAKRVAANSESGTSKFPRVLFTTFISTLPPVLATLYERLPSAIPGAVEFINVDKLASRVCAQAGQPPRLNPSLVEREFNRAFNAIVREGTPLHRAGLTRRYLREEVTAVLKGRGVASLEEYVELDRTGRRTPLTRVMREQTWALRTEWDRLLAVASVEDFPDVVLRAKVLAERRNQAVYAAAIVDECQDLTLVGLQFVRALGKV